MVADNFIDGCIAKCIEAATEHYCQRASEAADDADPERCESPLEEAFVRCWEVVRLGADYLLTLDTQMPAGSYRLDLIVHSHYRDFPKIAIELDGHDFHERTKEQATHRNERDRYLQMSGWKVFHISGSEFWRDPFAAVKQVHDYAIEEARVCDAARCRRRA